MVAVRTTKEDFAVEVDYVSAREGSLAVRTGDRVEGGRGWGGSADPLRHHFCEQTWGFLL